MSFLDMVWLEPGSSGSSHGVTVINMTYRVSFVIRPMLPCFTPSSVVGRVAAFSYNASVVMFKDS